MSDRLHVINQPENMSVTILNQFNPVENRAYLIIIKVVCFSVKCLQDHFRHTARI